MFHKIPGENQGFVLETLWGPVKITPRKQGWNVYAIVRGVAHGETHPKLKTAMLKALHLRGVFNASLANLAKNPSLIK